MWEVVANETTGVDRHWTAMNLWDALTLGLAIAERDNVDTVDIREMDPGPRMARTIRLITTDKGMVIT